MNLSSGCCYLYGSHLVVFITEQTMSIHSKTTDLFYKLCKGEYTLVTLPRSIILYRDSVDGTCDRVTYQKSVMQ